MTPEQFCAESPRANQAPDCSRYAPPAPKVCCMAMTAECLSCSESKTPEQFCADPAKARMATDCDMYIKQVAPPRPCCMSMNAECLACSANMTPKEYCSIPDNFEMAVDCDAYAPPPKVIAVPVAAASVSTTPKLCCRAMTAECMSCTYDMTPQVFCADPQYASMVGDCDRYPKPAFTARSVPSNSPATTTKTLYVADKQVPCWGPFERECLQVRYVPEGDWELFYDYIDGFEWYPGYQYELLVSVSPVANPPMDGSSLSYKLIELVSQAKPAVDGRADPTAAATSPRKCCKSMKLECLACVAGLTEEEYCARPDMAAKAVDGGCDAIAVARVSTTGPTLRGFAPAVTIDTASMDAVPLMGGGDHDYVAYAMRNNKPRYLTAAETTADTIVVTWVPPEGPIDCGSVTYQVRYRRRMPEDTGDWQTVTNNVPGETMAVIRGLDARIIYQVEVVPVHGNTVEGPRTRQQFRTRKDQA